MSLSKKLLRCVVGLALAALLVCNLYAEHSGRYLVGIEAKLLFAAGFIFLWTLFCALGKRPEHTAQQKHRRHRVYLWVLFVYYLWILLNMLFFDAAFGRQRAPGAGGFYEADINLIPFRTILNYWRVYQNGRLFRVVFTNLAGNLLAFAPMGVFLPALFRPMRNVLVYLITIILSVAMVETLQILTATGSCDIDDLILNAAGALAVWLIVQLPFIRKPLYGEKRI